MSKIKYKKIKKTINFKFKKGMLKRGGILILGLPVATDRKGYIAFNKGRVYGNSRLKTLLNGWQIMGGKRSDDDFHTVYLLKKI